jgi:hypothetical protein
MKISLVIAALLISVAAVFYFVLMPDSKRGRAPEQQVVQSSEIVKEVVASGIESTQDTNALDEEVNHESRRKEMQTAFTILEQSRKQLKSHANLVKSKIWGLELPSEQAKLVSKKLRRVFAYLKNPPMLGAYFEVGEIRNEVKKVDAMQEDLSEVEELVAALQNNGN